MSSINHAYQSLLSANHKAINRPRLIIPVVLGIIALLGAIRLLVSETGRNHYASWISSSAKTQHGLATIEILGGIPSTRNLHMTGGQCQVAFPQLYQEADRAQGYFADKGGISKADVDLAEEEGNARVVILNNTVRNALDNSYKPPHCANFDRPMCGSPVLALCQGLPRWYQLADTSFSSYDIPDFAHFVGIVA
jgi:hypothetical protein